MTLEEQRICAAKFLQQQGIEIQLDNDGLWMEETIFFEHKTKEILDYMIQYAEQLNNNQPQQK